MADPLDGRIDLPGSEGDASLGRFPLRSERNPYRTNLGPEDLEVEPGTGFLVEKGKSDGDRNLSTLGKVDWR
jgi:hypothetical protein